MSPTSSSFIDTLAFSSPPISTIDHTKLLEELDLWTNARFTFDMSAKVPGQHQIIPLQDQSVSTDELLLKYLSLEQQTISTIQQQQQQGQQVSIIPPRAILPKVESTDDEAVSTLSTPTSPYAAPVAANDLKKRARNIEDDVTAVEEDKRRRNTAASARFRAKKKLREHAMETAVKEMTSKSNKLEERVEELEREVRWLRSLLVGAKDNTMDDAKGENA